MAVMMVSMLTSLKDSPESQKPWVTTSPFSSPTWYSSCKKVTLWFTAAPRRTEWARRTWMTSSKSCHSSRMCLNSQKGE
eukprot:CAMPEP_0170455056 /NCGR_PEP_ID=MMETSP0123-20130129/3115_1 /TAXON_ID=182087 /ORGANISM="Favella ehrenbergii, Strain Fehren 1" /LENGTH=78 /DNA_ID=CAMNT_0010718001 /DNA_START=412 /DNA_END=648 /DNA_ORIENTATION=+